MKRVRVGLVGVENSHADQIVRRLNVDRAHGEVRIAALVAGDRERTAQLAALGGIDDVVADIAELHGEVDALIVTTRDGATHRSLAVPFLDAGIPVWVDKPLALTTDDGEAMVAAAERGGAALASWSTLRWLDDTDAVAAALTRIGALQSLTLTGPADPDDAHGGLFFYGIHLADLAQRLLPGPASAISVGSLPDGIVAEYRVGEVRVVLEFVRPTGDAQVPFHVVAVGRTGVVAREIVVGADYVAPGVAVFARMLATGVAPVTAAGMLQPIAVLERIASRP